MAYAFLVIVDFGCVIGVVAGVVGFWNLIRVSFSLRPSIDPWASGNPFNYLFRSDALTPSGLLARRRVGLALLVLVASVAVGAIAGLLAKWSA